MPPASGNPAAGGILCCANISVWHPAILLKHISESPFTDAYPFSWSKGGEVPPRFT